MLAFFGFIGIVCALISGGIFMNVYFYKSSTVHRTMRAKNVEIVRLYQEATVDVEGYDVVAEQEGDAFIHMYNGMRRWMMLALLIIISLGAILTVVLNVVR